MLVNVHRFQPHLLAGYGSGLHLLAEQQLAGRIQIRPAKIISSGEPLTGEMSQTIRQAFGVAPIDLYAACESLAIGAPAGAGRGIHLFDDWHCIEVVGRDGTPAATTGSCGRLRLTDLYNYTQPLIRYEMNDEVVPAAGPCPCGWPFPLAERIAGRTEEILWFEKTDGTKGSRTHPFAIAGLHAPGVERWQVVQTAPRLSSSSSSKTAADPTTVLAGGGENYLAILRCKRLGPFVTVHARIVDEIPNDPATGKCRLVIPYTPAVRVPTLSSPDSVCIHSPAGI